MEKEAISRTIAEYAAFETAKRNVINLEKLSTTIEMKHLLLRAKKAFLAQQVNSASLEIVIKPLTKEKDKHNSQNQNSPIFFKQNDTTKLLSPEWDLHTSITKNVFFPNDDSDFSMPKSKTQLKSHLFN